MKQKLSARLEQTEVQLAGCLTAAEGWATRDSAAKGDYGWSVAYQKTLELRLAYNSLQRQHTVYRRYINSLEDENTRLRAIITSLCIDPDAEKIEPL